MTKRIGNSRLYILIFIGIVSAFGPFVTDFYLPALPVLSEYFDTTASLVQLSLTFSMVGLAVGQLIIGPLSDKYGLISDLLYFHSRMPLLAGDPWLYLRPFVAGVVRSRRSRDFQVHSH